MANPHPRPGRAAPPLYPGAPRWVKLSGITAGLLVLLAVVLMLVSGGEHGPGRHFRSADVSSPTPPASDR